MQKYIVAVVIAVSLILIGYYFQKANVSRDMWRVVPAASSLKGKDQYDVIIIGGGFGGLSCGAFLSQHGYKVLLCEKNAVVGGLCSSYVKDGYTFSYGAENITGLGDRGALTYLMKNLKLSKESFFVPNSRRFIEDQHILDIAAVPNALQESLLDKYPSERTGIGKFFEMAEAVYQEGYDSEIISRWGIILPDEIMKKVMSREWLKAYPQAHSHLLEWKCKTYQQVIDEYIVNPEIKMVLSGFVSYLGKRPVEARASDVILTAYDGCFSGSFHAFGSISRFAEALAHCIEKNNGTVLTGQYVEKVDFSKGAVSGVYVQGKKYWSQVVVADVDVRSLFTDMIPPNKQTAEYMENLRGTSYGRSALCLHLAVTDSLMGYPSLIRDRTNSTFISISSKNDASLAPEGCSAVVVREFVNLTDFMGRPGLDLDSYVGSRAAILMQKAVAVIPELQGKSTLVKVVTPAFFESLANVPDGAIFGFDSRVIGKRPYFKTPFKGLYLVSASSQHGPGVQEVISNGILCAHDVMDWKQGCP